MHGARLYVGAILLSFTVAACADSVETLGPDVQIPSDFRTDEVTFPIDRDPTESEAEGTTYVVGCEGECRVTGSTDFLALLTADPLAVGALSAVRTPADLQFGMIQGFGTDTVPSGPVPGPVVRILKQGGGADLTAFLEDRGFVVPTDTVPTGPFMLFRDEGGERVEAALVMAVEDLIHKGVLTRSPQPASQVALIWAGGEYDGTTLFTTMPPTDTVPVGPGPAPAKKLKGR